MKLFAIALLVVVACVIGLLLAQVGKSLLTGQSYRVPVPQTVTVTVPYKLP